MRPGGAESLPRMLCLQDRSPPTGDTLQSLSRWRVPRHGSGLVPDRPPCIVRANLLAVLHPQHALIGEDGLKDLALDGCFGTVLLRTEFDSPASRFFCTVRG